MFVDPVMFLSHGRPQALNAELSLVEWKLLLYKTMATHYSHRDRPPLLPQGIADICTTIAELLGKGQAHCW